MLELLQKDMVLATKTHPFDLLLVLSLSGYTKYCGKED